MPRLQRHLDQWEPVISSLVAAARGDTVADQALDLVLASLGEHADWRQVVAVLRRIRAGERDPALVMGLIPSTPPSCGALWLRSPAPCVSKSTPGALPSLLPRGPSRISS